MDRITGKLENLAIEGYEDPDAGAGGSVSVPVTLAQGGTGATNVAQAVANLNNLALLPRFDAKMQFVRAGQGRARVLFSGDSTMVSGVNPDIGVPYLLANAFSNGGLPASADYASAGLFSVDTQRIGIGSSWTLDTAITSAGGNTYKASTTTNGITFTPQQTISHGRLWYVTRPGAGTVSIELFVSGALVATASVSTDAANGVASLDVTSGGTPFNKATLVVKYVSGGQVNIFGIEAWNGNSLSVLNASVGGSAISDWNDTATAYAWRNAIIAMAPDLVIFNPGINSMPGVSLATYQTQIEQFIDALKVAGIDLIMLTPVPANPTDGTHNVSVAVQDGYVGVNRAVALAKSVLLIDPYQYFVSYGVSSQAPYSRYIDTWVHPNVIGCEAIMGQIFGVLNANGGGSGRSNNQQTTFQIVNANSHYSIGGGINLSRGGANTLIVGVTGATANNTGIQNTIVGDGALPAVGAGFGHTAVGFNALLLTPNAGLQYNTALGHSAGRACASNNNVFIGHNAGLIATTGAGNTIVGKAAGSTVLTTGARNIIIGNGSVVSTTPAAATNDFINIGNGVRGYQTPPTIASGFGTAAAIAGASTFAFTINVGTGGSASSGVLTFPAAPNGWIVMATDVTTPGVNRTVMTAQTPTSVTLTNYNTTTGVAAAWGASDVLHCIAMAY